MRGLARTALADASGRALQEVVDFFRWRFARALIACKRA